jgi:hypothetical protein
MSPPESPKYARHVPPESPSSAKFRAVRTSEDGPAQRPEDVARNFEQLIQSDQTLQYTLTPENMRDTDVSHGRTNILSSPLPSVPSNTDDG